MQILNLKLKNFRNINQLNLNFSKKKNIFIGKNGMGKTNIIESIYVLAFTKSFRGNFDKVLIKNEENTTKIEGNVFDNYENKYSVEIDNEGKILKINNNKILKSSDYISKINLITYNPDDMSIIKESPSVRRNYFNLEISQLDNMYLKKLNIYNKLVKQRNSYLKTININGNSSCEYLKILTERIIKYGIEINKYRNDYIDGINLNINRYYFKITKKDNIYIKYYSDYNEVSFEKLVEKYRKSLNRDIILGKTSIGIHHDEFEITLNDQNIRDYGSEGQQKNAILSMKFAEIEIFKDLKKTYPILILDDLFSELDNYKINNILKLIKKSQQVFITVTDLDKVNKKYIEDSYIFVVNNGKAEIRK